MLQVNNLTKSFGRQLLFENATFSISPGERVGLVGRNGEGKTTLFRLIVGLDEQDSGEIVLPSGYTVGHLSQHINFTKKTVQSEGSSSLKPTEDGWLETYKVEAVLLGLGFGQEQFKMSPNELSGGFQVRLMLAKVLISNPNLLLLDEPTNYLDIVSLRWLRLFLRAWKGELMIITHDRDFMDSVTTHTVGIHRRRLRKISGPTQKLYEQILQEEEIHEQTRLNEEKKVEQIERFVNRFRAQASRARAVQSRIKQLEKREKLTALEELQKLEFSFNHTAFPGRWLVEVRDLSFGFSSEERPLIQNLSFAVGKEDRIGVIGPNGRGKTTLLNLIAGELAPVAGSVQLNQNAKLGYFGQTNIERLHLSNTIEEEILAAHPDHSRRLARSICGAMMFEGDTALKRIQVLSGGERSRVLLGKLLVRPANFLLLDEPTNHLDMDSVDSLIEAVDAFKGAAIFVTHSEMVLKALATRLIVFDGGEVVVFEGSYDDFLARRGWSDEKRDVQETGSRERDAVSKKEQRALRAAIISRKSKALNPLKEKIARYENEIIAREERIEAENNELLNALERQDAAAITALSTSIHQAKQEIDALFHKLANVARDADEVAKSFDVELDAVR